MEEQKYVGEVALQTYNAEIQGWFQEQVDAIDVIESVYHESTRILEFTKGASTSGGSGTILETCTVKFPKSGVGRETLYYTGANGQFVTQSRNDEIATYVVLKNTVMISKDGNFGNTYVIPNTANATVINQFAFAVHGDVELSYSDGAPA